MEDAFPMSLRDLQNFYRNGKKVSKQLRKKGKNLKLWEIVDRLVDGTIPAGLRAKTFDERRQSGSKKRRRSRIGCKRGDLSLPGMRMELCHIYLTGQLTGAAKCDL